MDRIVSLWLFLVLELGSWFSARAWSTMPVCSVRTTAAFSTNLKSSIDEIPSLYKEQETMLVRRGELEGRIMAENESVSPLESDVVKGSGSGGGFGGAKSQGGSKNAQQKAQGKAHAATLKREGVVRIDKVLPDKVADEMLDFVKSLRKESEDLIRSGEIQTIERFADVLLKENRCDMTMPLGSDTVASALQSVLVDSPVGATIASVLGKDAVLHEFSCLISDPGSQRQVMHPDTPYRDERPVLYTCFIALQDIDITMGPTTWLPGTNNAECHERFQDEQVYEDGGESPMDKLLRTTPAKLGTLPKGSCALYDSRTLHCGGANVSDRSRALFYFSFRNPNIGHTGNPPSIRREVVAERFTLSELQKELKQYSKGKPNKLSS